MLSDYRGPANSSKMLQYLVGETILGAMMDGHHIVLILSSQTALVLTSPGGEISPAYWKENKDELKQRTTKRLEEIRQHQAELKHATFLDSLPQDLTSSEDTT